MALMSLGKEAASAVIARLSPDEVKRLSRAMQHLVEVSREDQLEVARELQKLLNASEKLVVSGEEFAREIFTSAFGQEEGARLLEGHSGNSSSRLASLLESAPFHVIETFVTSEHPQTAAYLLTHLKVTSAADAVNALDEDLQTDILLRVAQLNNVNSQVIDELYETFQAQLTAADHGEERINGQKKAADILSAMDRTREEALFENLREMDPDMASQIKDLMFTFEDCLNLNARDMQTLLQECQREQITLALKTASSALKAHILAHVSKRAAENIQDELESLGKVRKKDVEAAQKSILETARILHEQGTISLKEQAQDEYV